MLRDHLFHQRAPADPLFRWRGGETTRVEALSDGVFALTITLIVATTQVPGTFEEIWDVLLEAPVLAVCFTLLVLLWHDHYRFCRRYGLEDAPTTALNMLLLFLVLLYAYPLKFLFSFLWKGLALGSTPMGEFFPSMSETMPFRELFENPYMQSVWMMYLYGIGCASVFAVLFLMHLRAYRLREQLALDAIELELTRSSLRSHGISAGIAALSVLLALQTKNAQLAGMVYALNLPLHLWNGLRTTASANRLKQLLDVETTPSEATAIAADSTTGPPDA